MRARALGPGFAAMLAASTTHAQNAEISPPSESVLVTATRLPQAAATIAAGVDVIDAATIAARGYLTLADALSAVAGAHLVQSGGPGANASLFVRGADSDQVQVLIDGMPVNDPSGPGGAYNFGVDTLADVARIEVVRGPMSAVYGSGAIGGVVNIITRRGGGALHGEATIGGGVPAALLAQGRLGGASGAWDYVLSGEAQSDRGFDATPRREAVHTGERDGYRTQLATGELGWTAWPGTRLFVDLRARRSVYGYDDVNDPAFDDPDQTARDDDVRVRTGVDSRLLDGVWRTGLAFAFDQSDRRYRNLLDAADPNQAAEDSHYQGRRADLQWNNTVALPDTGWMTGGAVTAGYEHSAEHAQERLVSLGGGFAYDAAVDASDRRDAGYAGLAGTVLQRLALAGNARTEQVSGVGAAVTWRLGGSLALPGLGSHLKASYGTAFLAPSLFDRYGIDNFGYVGNAGLRPERSRGYEIGWVAALGRVAELETTWFHTEVSDLIQPVFAPVYTSVNVAQARLQGVETTLRLHPARWLDLQGTYTYTDARDARTGTLLLRRPYDTGAMTLTLRPIAAVTVVPQLVFAGGDRDFLIDDGGYPAGNGAHGGGAVVNCTGTYRISGRLTVFASLKNIGGSRYEAASGYAPAGRSFVAGLRLKQ